MSKTEKTFEFHWKDGSVTVSKGITPEKAFTKAGFGAGSIPALDYYSDVSETLNQEEKSIGFKK